MKKNLIVLQDGYKECGAAALLSIIRYYHGNISINRLVSLTHTDKFGTSFYNLKDAANEIGLEANGYKVDDMSSLLEIKKPFICQLINHGYEHFVTVYEVRKKNLVIMDPAVGNRVVSIKDFSEMWTGYIMIFQPKKELSFYKEEKFLNRIIIEIIKKNKSIVFNILFLSVIFTITSCFFAMYFQVVVDYISKININNLFVISIIFVFLLLIKCFSNFFRNELLIYLNQKLDCSLFLSTFQKLLLLPYSYYKNRTTGEVTSRINDLVYVKNILNKIILTVFLDLLLFIVSGIILVVINFKLFIFLILIIIAYIMIFLIFRPRLKRYVNIGQENSSDINSYLIETINGFETIKNIHAESIVNEKMEKLYVRALNDSFVYSNMSNLEVFMEELVTNVGLFLIEFLGGYLIITESASIGSIITYVTLASYFIEPIKNMLELSKEYYYVANSLTRVNHLFDIDDEDFSTKTNFDIQGNIKLNHLLFSYNGEDNILNDVSFSINKGERVMILGSSGSGKSTILKLLLKYYSVSRDMVYLDDVDINDICVQNVRNNIISISQNEILYTDTIKNNITFGQMVSDEEFMEVCELTRVSDFVKDMFLGYETKLEENGLNLSGGQRQRIVLARMLLKKSKIMLIDEGLNATDVNLERIILKKLFAKYTDRTIIIVTHRVENLDLFSKVIRLESGMVSDINSLPEKRLL